MSARYRLLLLISSTMLAVLYSLSGLAATTQSTKYCESIHKIDSASKSREAIPLNPVVAIVNAFHSHRLVAISEGSTHGDEQFHAFLRALISDPRFTSTVNDIVVEWGNGKYQSLIDKYTQGDDVSYDSLRQVWQNTTQPHEVWDGPVYEEFFKTVRDVNASLPKGRKLRILLGDHPIDWNTVHNNKDLLDTLQKGDAYAANLVQQDVLKKNRHALIIYGGLHLQRKNIFLTNNKGSGFDQNLLIHLLEKKDSTRVFTIWVATDLMKLQANIATWPVPSIALLQGTTLGAADFTWYYPYQINVLRNGKITPVTDKHCPMPMEDEFDAVMYLGSGSSITISRPSASTCSAPHYMEMRFARMRLAGYPQSSLDELKKYCAFQISSKVGLCFLTPCLTMHREI